MEHIKELLKFLDKNVRTEVKVITLHELLGLTGSKDGCTSIQNDSDVLKALIENIDDKHENVSKTACLVLVNVTASNEGTESLMNTDKCEGKKLIGKLLKHVIDKSSATADAACMVLSNITRKSSYAELVLDCLETENIDIHKLFNAFTKISYNSKGCNLHHLASFFSNLSQIAQFRRLIMNKNGCLIQKLLPFIHSAHSITRRQGAVATVRNCCFDIEHHEWLLGPEVDILPRLLLPLAGPEQFDDDDMDKLPVELQYLGDNKTREIDGNIRKLLLEAIHQLCAKKSGREFLRKKNAYIILREYHKWEKDRSILLACENIIDILIRTEEEIGEDNLKELIVPDEYIGKFEEMDKQYLEDV